MPAAEEQNCGRTASKSGSPAIARELASTPEEQAPSTPPILEGLNGLERHNARDHFVS